MRKTGQQNIICLSLDNLKCNGNLLWADLQCIMEEWCSPYSSWLSLMKGCSDRSPLSPSPKPLLLFEEDDSRGLLKVSVTGSASPSSTFFSGVWHRSYGVCYRCQRNQHLVAVVCNLKNNSINFNEFPTFNVFVCTFKIGDCCSEYVSKLTNSILPSW